MRHDWFQVRAAAGHPAFISCLLIVAAIAFEPGLLNERAIRNILTTATPCILAGVGQSLVILSGGIDLSVGALISLSNVLFVHLAGACPDQIALVALLVLCLGALAGCFNGLLISLPGANPFIITLAVGLTLQGMTLGLMSQPGGTISAGFRAVSRSSIGAVPVAFLALLALLCLLAFCLRRTPWGVSTVAIGGNRDAARLSGINVHGHVVGLYAFSGLLAAGSGLFLAARISSADPLIGEPYTLDSITAAVLGGASLAGGVASIAGTTFAGIVLAVMNTLLNLTNVSPFYQWIIKGMVLICALSLDFLRRRRPAT